MQYAFNFKEGNSLTLYFELQEKIDKLTEEKHNYQYLSPSYNHFGKWIITYFVDIEKDEDPWYGLDWTYNLKNTSQLSIFYGSQRGGLVCANGSCVIQPDFEDGYKITYLISI